MVIFFFFGEGIIISSVVKFGYIYSLFLLTPIFITIECLVYTLYKNNISKNKLILLASTKIKNLENKIPARWKKTAIYSKFLAIILCALVSGIFITPVFIGILGYRNQVAYALNILSATLFALFWISAYSGIIFSFLKLING